MNDREDEPLQEWMDYDSGGAPAPDPRTNYDPLRFTPRKVPGDSQNRLRGETDGPLKIGPLDPYFANQPQQRSSDVDPTVEHRPPPPSIGTHG